MQVVGTLDAGSFLQHGLSIYWMPYPAWAEAISNGLLVAANFSILATLGTVLYRRRDLAFARLFVPSTALILLSGFIYLFSTLTFAALPHDGLAGTFKTVAAIVSAAIAITFWVQISRGLALSGTNGGSAIVLDQRYRLLVDAVVNYAILMLDPAGHVESWNPGAERIKGYKHDEILGKHFSCFYTQEDIGAGKPEHGLAAAAAEGRFETEDWRVRKDGSLFWANVIITAIRGPDGELIGYGKVTRDLTERRTAQKALRDANEELESRVLERTESLTTLARRLEGEIEDRKAAESSRREAAALLQATFDAAPFPILITGQQSEVLMWNRAGEATFGHTEHDLMENGYKLLVPDDAWEEAARVRTAAQAGRLNTETHATHRDGRILDIRLSAVPLFHVDGSLRAIVSMMEDLTQARQIETRLRHSQKMEAIGTLTGGMAHDFNNLLGIIIGNLELLRESRPDDGEVCELSGEAIDAATRGAELTRSLLAFARRQPLQPRQLDLDVVIGSVVKMIGRLLGEDIEIILNLADDICPVVADPAQLEAALTNLATNARDAMTKGGRLTITTAQRRLDEEYASANPDVQPGDYAMIEITDTGAGIPHEVKGRIFEPFFTTKKEQNTGLGLSMVFGFVKQSGGHVAVYSEVGVGTTFRLYFPRTVATEDGAIDLRPDGPLAGNGEIILAVEDSPPLRRIVGRQLRGLGYRVLEAENGAEALKLLETEKIDLLFTDVVMPGGIDGFELADRAKHRWPDIKVILTSGFPQTRFIDDLAPRGFPLLSKPYRKGNLALLIRAVLDGRKTKIDQKNTE